MTSFLLSGNVVWVVGSGILTLGAGNILFEVLLDGFITEERLLNPLSAVVVSLMDDDSTTVFDEGLVLPLLLKEDVDTSRWSKASLVKGTTEAAFLTVSFRDILVNKYKRARLEW